MSRRIVSGIMLTLLLTSILAFNIQPAKAEPKTWTVDDDGPADFHKIQEAIDNAVDGDTIVVLSGTYYEHIDLHKSVNLIAKDALTAILDGQGSGTVVRVTANNVTVDGFTIKNGEIGIDLFHVGNCLIKRNAVENNQDGILGESCWNCTVIENNSSDNSSPPPRGRGILLGNSWDCNVESNIVERNEGYGLNLHLSQNCSVVRNTVRGGHHDYDAIGLLTCINCLVAGNTAENSQGRGVWIDSSTNCVIDDNHVNNNTYGIGLVVSSQCKIKQNDISDSQVYSLELYSSNTNTFYNNNFVATIAQQAESINSVNIMYNDTWKEGNYWSDYDGADSDNDGIGDTAYIIDNDELDNYPLMARFTSFPINRPSGMQNVEAVSNSTISNFEFNTNKNEIRFNVSGENNTYGFCRIGIPKVLMDGTLVVKIDGNAPITQEKLEHSNLAFNYLYFTYIHSVHQVTITLETHQEFFPLQFLPLLVIVLAASLVASILFLAAKRKRLHLHMRRKR